MLQGAIVAINNVQESRFIPIIMEVRRAEAKHHQQWSGFKQGIINRHKVKALTE